MAALTSVTLESKTIFSFEPFYDVLTMYFTGIDDPHPYDTRVIPVDSQEQAGLRDREYNRTTLSNVN